MFSDTASRLDSLPIRPTVKSRLSFLQGKAEESFFVVAEASSLGSARVFDTPAHGFFRPSLRALRYSGS